MDISPPPNPQDDVQQHQACNSRHEQKIDNSSKVLEKIAELYAERLLSDITLEVDGKRFPAHRLILCASSDVFQVMLMSSNWTESNESNIVLQEEANCSKVFPEFLAYLYTGRIEVNQQNVLPLLVLADKYNINDLVSLAVDYMVSHIVNAAEKELVVSWLQYTLDTGHRAVAAACFDFICWNFELVSDKGDFITFECDVLVSFLKCTHLVVKDELTLFKKVTIWLDHQDQDDPEFEQLVVQVMECVRFPMMSPRQLASLLLSPLVVKFKDFFVDRMSAAMTFHSNSASNWNCKYSDTSLNKLLYSPRLYTTEKWSSSLVVENYNNLPNYGVRTLVFTTPTSLQEFVDEREPTPSTYGQGQHEWAVDLFPKGVWFKKFFMIGWQGKVEIPEWVSKTVRLSITAKPATGSGKVSIGLLIHGQQDGVEHVRSVVRRDFSFNYQDNLMVNVDDLVDFDQLNFVSPVQAPPCIHSTGSGRRRFGHQAGSGLPEQSKYLVGADCNTFKIQVIVTPLV